MHVERVALGNERGTDLRREVFERAWDELSVGARVLKEGIASWGIGIGGDEGWRKNTLERTIRAQERGKLWRLSDDASPTCWSYQTPAERVDRLRITRGVVMSHDVDPETAQKALDNFADYHDTDDDTDNT